MSNNTWSLPLKRARERQGLSLAQAAHHLKLPEPTVVMLEREALRAEDMTPYLRGYLKNYCRLLGLPPPLWPQDSMSAHNHQRKSPSLQRARRPTLAWKGILLVLVGACVTLLLGAIVHHQWHAHSQAHVAETRSP